ncbi:hypothetical protein GCM10023176_35290 [Micromonospora coerulea]|uniref:Transposase IS4-like domain-containing protein n=1 Tax=Micromonospora coerulea TaxID=47856 RepID=A0ABP8SQX3_9ACTN
MHARAEGAARLAYQAAGQPEPSRFLWYGPLLALAPVRRRPVDQIAIVDGTLIPTRDHRLAAKSKNYRYSTNLQVAIDAGTRLVIAVGDPQPGQPQRHHRLPHQRYPAETRRAARHGPRRLPRQPRGDHPVPQARRWQRPAGLKLAS